MVNSFRDRLFNRIHNAHLIYNTSWEDPRIDRQLLQLNQNSRMLMITGAGCNTLDYLLDSPARIDTVDVNFRQNALLQLKMALIKKKVFDNLFEMFGDGCCEAYHNIYDSVRDELTEDAQKFWDLKIRYFSASKRYRKSFYYHGTTGAFAWLFKSFFFQTQKDLEAYAMCLIDAGDLEEQRDIYAHIEPLLYTRSFRWILKQPAILAMLGVPRSQIQLLREQYPDGLNYYFENKTRQVAREVGFVDNYFWRVYFTGSYNRSCCPNYLKAENFGLLRSNLERVHVHTQSVSDFLKSNPGVYTHFVLLDHQDWLADSDDLAEEWQLILENSQKGSKILMRSAGLALDFLPEMVKKAIRFFPELTGPLHKQDRVGTHGSLHLAEVM